MAYRIWRNRKEVGEDTIRTKEDENNQQKKQYIYCVSEGLHVVNRSNKRKIELVLWMWKRGGQIPCGGALKVAWWDA